MLVTKLCLDASDYRKELARVVEETRRAARDIADAAQDKTVNVDAVVSGKDAVDEVAQAVGALPDVKTVNVDVQTNGASAVSSLSGGLARAGKSALSFKNVAQTVVQSVSGAFGTLGNIISKAVSGGLGWVAAAATAAVAAFQHFREKAEEEMRKTAEEIEALKQKIASAEQIESDRISVLKELNAVLDDSQGRSAGLAAAVQALAEMYGYAGLQIDEFTGKILNLDEIAAQSEKKLKSQKEALLKKEAQQARQAVLQSTNFDSDIYSGHRFTSSFWTGDPHAAAEIKPWEEKGSKGIRKYAEMQSSANKEYVKNLNAYADRLERIERFRKTGYATEEEENEAKRKKGEAIAREAAATTQEANRIAKEDEEAGKQAEFALLDRAGQKKELKNRIAKDDAEIAELERRRAEAAAAEKASDDPVERARQGRIQADAQLEIEKTRSSRNESKRRLDAMNDADRKEAEARRDAARQSAEAAETALARENETPEERKKRLQSEVAAARETQAKESAALIGVRDETERARIEERIAKAKEAQSKAQSELNKLEKSSAEERKAQEKAEEERQKRLSDWKSGQLADAQDESDSWLTREERRSAHMDRALKDAEAAKGAPLTDDEAENTRKIADLTFAIRESANSFTPGQLQVMTNDLTSRGGFQTGGRVSDIANFNQNVQNQMAAIRELLQNLRDAAVAQEQRSRPGGSSTWPY